MKLLMVAGELSGDAHGGALLANLKRHLPGLEVYGIGGPRMVAAGLRPLHPLSDLQVHGLLEVVRHLPRLYRILWEIEASMDTERPDAVLLVDYPGFNLKLAAGAKSRGIPVWFYSSPQVWAWRGGRLRTIAKVVDHMIVLFPFEVPLYEKAGVPVEFHGHPLVGTGASDADVAELRTWLRADHHLPLVAVMPGSRPSEIRRILPTLLQGLKLAGERGFHGRYVLPLAPNLDGKEVGAMIAAAGVPIDVVQNAFLPLLRMADFAVSASGTATLQLAMAGVPFITVYRVSPLTYFIARRYAYVKHFAMANILAGHEVVPELLQEDLSPEKVCEALMALAQDEPRRRRMRDELLRVTATLGAPGAYERAAAAIAGRLTNLRPAAGARP
ncbi:MAG TPA: lipid-A-disaccharide synthase [bacterium]